MSLINSDNLSTILSKGKEKIADGSLLNDDSIIFSKINSNMTNLATEFTADKSIDKTTGQLIDSPGSYVTNMIQIRDDNGIIHKNIYINYWKSSSLLWVGYGKDGTTVVKTGVGGTSTTKLRRVTVGSFTSVYYVRVVGYTDLCASSEFMVTDGDYKSLQWLSVDETNFTKPLPAYLCNSNICTLRSNNSLNMNIQVVYDSTTDSTITVTANKTVMAYVNNISTKIATSSFKLSQTISTSGDYALIYNIDAKAIQLVLTSKLADLKCAIIMYLYMYKQTTVSCYLLGNDAKIKVSWTHKVQDTSKENTYVEITDILTDKPLDNVFTHNITPTHPNWLDINRVGVDKYKAPYPFIANSTFKVKGGMLVAENGLCSMYKGLDKGHGGHLFQGWAQNTQYRCTILNDNKMDDGLPVTAFQNWITKGLKHDTDCAYGWIHLGCDDFKIVDEVIDKSDEKMGLYVHPKVSIVGTPLLLEPKDLLETMPQGYEISSNGEFALDDNGMRIKKPMETIKGKNILQVNKNNQLCFHSATDNKWYKVPLEEFIQSYNYSLETLNAYPSYYINYTEDYKLDTLLMTGVSTITELETFLGDYLMYGQNARINTIDLGCSVVTAKTYSGTSIHCRNLDINKSPLGIVRISNNKGYSSINSVPLKILYEDTTNLDNTNITLKALPYCCTDGINSEGLVVSLLKVFGGSQDENKENGTNVIINVALRALLDKCATTEEAITLLNSFNMHMIDTNYHIAISDATNNNKVVEYFNNTMTVYEAENDYLAATNFLLNNTESDTDKTGQDRYNTLKTSLESYNGKISESFGLELLKTVKQGTSDNGTILSAIYNATNKSVSYYIAQDFDTVYNYSLSTQSTVKSVLPQGVCDNDFAKVEVTGKHLKITLKNDYTQEAPLYILLHNSLNANTSYSTYATSILCDANVNDNLKITLSNYTDSANSYTEFSYFDSSFNEILKCVNSTKYSLSQLTNNIDLTTNVLGLICVIVGSTNEVIETDIKVEVNNVEIGNNVIVE